MMIELESGAIVNTNGAPPAQPTEGQGVSHTAAARIADQSAALASLGIGEAGEAKTEAGYALGTRAFQSAVTGRLQEQRLSALEMPPAIGALESLRDRAKSLDRHAADVHLSLIRATANKASAAATGALYVQGGVSYQTTPDAWTHLGGFYGAPGLGAYLPIADPGVRAVIVDHHRDLLRAEREIEIGKWKAAGEKGSPPEVQKVRISSRKNLTSGVRQAYRIASTGYTPFEVVDACEALLASSDVRAALAGARAAVKWDGRRASLDLVWTTDEKLYADLGDFAAGDTFQYAQRIVLDEVKSGSTEHYSFSRRNECLNMIIISTRKGERASWRHVGNAGVSVAEGLLSRIRSHRAAVDSFVGTWVAARRDRILDEMACTPERMFGALLAEGLIDFPGLRTTEKKIDALCTAFAKEPGQSLADVVNAATRCAHEGDWWNSSEAQEESEIDAGKLLYVRNIRARVSAGLASYDDSHGEGSGAES